MTPHPRLYVSASCFTRLRERKEDPWFLEYLREVKKRAEDGLDPATLSFDHTKHNSHLERAKAMQNRLLTLSLEALLSGEQRFVTAAMQHVQVMHDWEHWSWLAWRKGNCDPTATFDLSYGENSATLGIVHDWLKPLLSAADVDLILKTARRPVDSFLKNGEQSWWYGKKESNWNPVCAGGFGMLVLSLFEHLPKAEGLLRSVENSVARFVEHLQETDGAWPEGAAYWNYGMRYAFMFLSSYENAMGCRHPLLDAPSTKETVYFAPSFCPHGTACSFGDANSWRPLPFHHAMAERVGALDLLPVLRAVHPEPSANPLGWPNAAETALLVPDAPLVEKDQDARMPAQKLYNGVDWGYVADRMPNPNVYLAVRGGTTEVPHGHIDLTSFHAVMGGESVIVNYGMNEYLDTTFGKRRFELYDTVSASKNVALVNGVGVIKPSKIRTEQVLISPTRRGFWMDAKEAMGLNRDGVPAVKTKCRLFLLLDNESILVLDSIELPIHGRCEERWHTEMIPTLMGNTVHLRGRQQRFAVTHACTQPALLFTGLALFSNPTKVPIHVCRWISERLETRIAFAMWITPGDEARSLAIKEEGEHLVVLLDRESLRFDRELRPIA